MLLVLDINSGRVAELKSGLDKTLEVESDNLKEVLTDDLLGGKGLYITSNSAKTADSNVYIVTVPTPTDEFNKPVFTAFTKG